MTLLCLINTPTAYTSLRKEVDQAIAQGRMSSPISDNEAKALPYLQAVIREGIRIYPPVTGLGSKQVPPSGDIISGYFVPGGTQIGHNFAGIMQSKAIWGPDAHVFRPERWLEYSKDQFKDMAAIIDLNFGYGKYGCLGKNIALMELNKVFVEVSLGFCSRQL